MKILQNKKPNRLSCSLYSVTVCTLGSLISSRSIYGFSNRSLVPGLTNVTWWRERESFMSKESFVTASVLTAARGQYCVLVVTILTSGTRVSQFSWQTSVPRWSAGSWMSNRTSDSWLSWRPSRTWTTDQSRSQRSPQVSGQLCDLICGSEQQQEVSSYLNLWLRRRQNVTVMVWPSIIDPHSSLMCCSLVSLPWRQSSNENLRKVTVNVLLFCKD